MKEAEEIRLATNLVVLRDKLEPLISFAEGRYQEALEELANLREPVDAFFDKVMVNAEDKDLRINRLTLLLTVSCSCRLLISPCCNKFSAVLKNPLRRVFSPECLRLFINGLAISQTGCRDANPAWEKYAINLLKPRSAGFFYDSANHEYPRAFRMANHCSSV